jgi:hypothetical protein
MEEVPFKGKDQAQRRCYIIKNEKHFKEEGSSKLHLAMVIIQGSLRLSSSEIFIDCQYCLLKLQLQKRWALVSNDQLSQIRQRLLSLSVKLFLMSISFMYRQSLAKSQKKALILGVHFDFQI